MPSDRKRRVAVITGASAGVGRATCARLRSSATASAWSPAAKRVSKPRQERWKRREALPLFFQRTSLTSQRLKRRQRSLRRNHERRELYVGSPTVVAIVGDKIAPDLLDRYLARTVYEGHQRDESDHPQRPDNLWEPVPEDHGAHGPLIAMPSDTACSSSRPLIGGCSRWAVSPPPHSSLDAPPIGRARNQADPAAADERIDGASCCVALHSEKRLLPELSARPRGT